MTTNWVASSLSYLDTGSPSDVSVGLRPLWRLRRIFLASFAFGSSGILGLWLHCPSLYLCCHLVFPYVVVSIFFLFDKDTRQGTQNLSCLRGASCCLNTSSKILFLGRHCSQASGLEQGQIWAHWPDHGSILNCCPRQALN